MKKLLSIWIILLSVILGSCSPKAQIQHKELKISGVIHQQGITTYQYGSHILIDGSTTYALRSTKVLLDDYLNKKVTVKGKLIEGYPLEGGPVFIEVESVTQPK